MTIIVKWFSFPMDFNHIVKLTEITNYIYIEAKSPVLALCYKCVFLYIESISDCLIVPCTSFCHHWILICNNITDSESSSAVIDNMKNRGSRCRSRKKAADNIGTLLDVWTNFWKMAFSWTVIFCEFPKRIPVSKLCEVFFADFGGLLPTSFNSCHLKKQFSKSGKQL